jgi:hypothetical protein
MGVDPPQPLLSADGRLAVIRHRGGLVALDTGTAAVTPLEGVPPGLLVAVSPRGDFIALAGEAELSLLRGRAPFETLATVGLAGRPLRVAVGDDGLVAVAAQTMAGRVALLAWSGEGLRPLLAEDGEPLGALAPDGLLLDARRARVLLWQAPAAEGEEPAIRLLGLAEDGLHTLWSGEGTSFTPLGMAFPLVQGRVGLYTRQQLLAINAEGAGWSTRRVRLYPFEGLETVAVSPEGGHLAWLGPASTTRDDRQPLRAARRRLRVARLADGSIIRDVIPAHPGAAPALGVDDVGRATLAFGQPPDRVLVFVVADGPPEQRADVALGRG